LSTTPEAAVNAGGVAFPVEFVVVAHQDDWQLFQGDRTASAVQTAAKVVIAYVTAGDAGSATVNPAFWQAREVASKASVDSITAVGDWACADATVNGHVILRCTKANTVSYYMRLPDGNGEGQGYGAGSLALLRSGGVSSLRAVNSSTTYTSWNDLVSTLGALVAFEGAGEPAANVALHTQDWDLELNGSDHSDHVTTGELVRAASAGHGWNLFWYIGYGNLYEPPNVSGAELATKWKLIVAYDDVMKDLMGETIIGTSHAEEWSERTIFRSELSALPPPPPGIPYAPTGLAAAAVNTTTIDLTWIDNANDEDGFRIERAPDAGGVAGTYAEIAAVAANVATYSDASAAPDTRYWYRALAYTAVGNSSYSNAANATTSPPAAPSALLATAVSTSRIDLVWTDNAADEQGFRIERAPDAGGVAGAYVEIATVAANVATYSNTGLAGSTPYWYRVHAFNTVGSSAYSNEANTSTPAPPIAPSALVTTPFSTTRIDLAWADNASNEQGFRIERAPDAGGVAGTYAQIASVGANVRTYSNTGLTAATRYWYRVRAYNTLGNSAYSNDANATTLLPPPPIAPTALLATAVSGVRIDLAWTDNATDEQGYRLERAPDAGGVAGAYTQIASVSANVRTYSNTGLVASTRFWYRVRAYNAAGNSAYSNETSATTLPPPAAPSALLATPVSGTRIDLAWTDNATDEQGFRVERAPDAGGVAGTYAQITSVGVNVRTYSNTGLTNGTVYWYRVRAYNASGNSAYSNQTSARTLAPATPTNLQAAPVSAAVVDLTWVDNAVDETAYRVQRAPDAGGVPGSYSTVATLGANVTTYRSTGLAAATWYWFRVRAENASGNSPYTPPTSVATLVLVAPNGLTANAYLVGTQRNVDLTWTRGSELTVDIYRNGTRIVSGRANDGGTYNNKPPAGTTTFQVCAAGKTGAANCSQIVTVTF